MPSIQRLKPEFVLSYKYNKKLSNNLSRFISVLEEGGFYPAVRDNGDQLLVFLKLANYKLVELTDKDSIKNYEFGITAPNDSSSDKFRIIYDYLSDLIEDHQSSITSIAPITENINNSTIYNDITNHIFRLKNNPSTNFIKENFGMHIALYFEFVKFFMNWLFFLAAFGVVSYFKAKDKFSLTFCGINLVWSVLFITFWKKRERYLVSFWGYSNFHLIQDHELQLMDINEYFEQKSSYKHKTNYEGAKFVKQLLFIPIAIVFAAILMAYQLGCFVVEIFLNEIYDGPGKMFLSLVPTILLSVFVPVLTIVFNIIANMLVKFENHKNSYTKTNSLVIKQFVLNFLTSYMPLLITAFIYLPFAHLVQPKIPEIQQSLVSNLNENRFYYKYLIHLKHHDDFAMNQQRLNIQFFYFVVTNQVVQLVMKYGLPHIILFAMGFISKPKPEDEPKDSVSEKEWLNKVRKFISLGTYDVDNDFRFMTIVFGYLVLFGPVFSLAPLFTLIFLFLTLKLDYLKLLNGKYFKPPVPERVDSIYPWNHALFVLGLLGSIISPAITAFYRHGDKPPKSLGQFTLDKASVNVSSKHLMIILLCSEHFFVITWMILSKMFELFKTEKEWENDFTDNDIKLRHDYYTNTIKGPTKPMQDGEWEAYTADKALDDVSRIVEGKVPDDQGEEIELETVGNGVGALGYSRHDVEDLNEIKNRNDEVINVKSLNGEQAAAIIDDNQHFERPTVNAKQDLYHQDFARAKEETPETFSDEREEKVEGGGKEKDEKKRRSPLKKILKRK